MCKGTCLKFAETNNQSADRDRSKVPGTRGYQRLKNCEGGRQKGRELILRGRKATAVLNFGSDDEDGKGNEQDSKQNRQIVEQTSGDSH